MRAYAMPIYDRAIDWLIMFHDHGLYQDSAKPTFIPFPHSYLPMAAYYIIPYITRIVSYFPCIPWRPLRVCQSCSIHIWPSLVVCLYYRNHRSFTLKAGLRDVTDRERRLPVLTTMTINPDTAFIQGTRVSRGRVPKCAADREVPVGF